MVGKVSLRVQELNCSLETKSLDNVFVNVQVSIQYMVLKDKVYSAFYILENPAATIRSYVYDTIRASLCHMSLDHAFESKVIPKFSFLIMIRLLYLHVYICICMYIFCIFQLTLAKI